MKLEALEVLKNRRSIRKFKAEQVDKATLDIVLEAGTYAPTARGLQSPTIVAVQDSQTVAQLDALNARVWPGHEKSAPYYGAPTIILVLIPEDKFIDYMDAASVCTNMLNAAYAAGLGSCWINRPKEMFETEEGKALLRKWGLPETMIGVCSIALGYADCPHPEAKARKADYIVRV